MDDNTRAMLESCGVNIKVTMERFMGKEELLFKFLKKFTADESYSNLIRTMDEKNFEEAFSHAHTLKGVSANLGLGNLTESSSALTEKLRAKDYTDYKGMVEKIKADYADAMDMISKL
ncbi:MAG: Hpt domain-containing protein [Lachnospiraceae bacterium]|nr:Hpt domain-containing protein [Lachnospiraceae bacterium]